MNPEPQKNRCTPPRGHLLFGSIWSKAGGTAGSVDRILRQPVYQHRCLVRNPASAGLSSLFLIKRPLADFFEGSRASPEIE